MAKLIEVHAAIPKRVLIMGLPGTGKSTLAAALAAEYKLHWIAIENAVDTLLKLPIEHQENIEIYNLPDSAAYPIAADTLMPLFKTGVATFCDAHGKINCLTCKKDNLRTSTLDLRSLKSNEVVVLDSGTQLAHSILAHCMRNKPVDAKPERDDWGALRKYTEFFTSQFQAANYNLIVICHAIEAELENGRKKLVPNFGSAAMSAEFAKAFSDVIYTDVVNKKHLAYSSSTYSNVVLTKSRTDFVIESLEQPSLLPLFRGDHLSGRLRLAATGNTVNTQSEEVQELIAESLRREGADAAVDALVKIANATNSQDTPAAALPKVSAATAALLARAKASTGK